MSPPNTPSLQLLSLNVNGLRGKQKRAALFATLQSGPWQVVALQETHHANCNSALAKFVQLPAFVVILLQHLYVAHDVTLCGLSIRRFVTNFATKPSLHNVSKVSASAPTSATASASAPSQHQHSTGAMQHPGRHRSGRGAPLSR